LGVRSLPLRGRWYFMGYWAVGCLEWFIGVGE